MINRTLLVSNGRFAMYIWVIAFAATTTQTPLIVRRAVVPPIG